MKKSIIVIAWLAVSLPAVCLAQVPLLITYVGELSKDGQPVTEAGHSFTFRLYDAQDGLPESAVWVETHEVDIVSGRFVVLLGSQTPFDLSTFDGAPKWLGIEMDAGEGFPDRLQLVSVPYALKAGDCAKLGGQEPATFVQKGDVIIVEGDDVVGPVAECVECSDADTVEGKTVEDLDQSGDVISIEQNIENNYYTKADVDQIVANAVAAAISQLKDCPPGYEKAEDANILATGFYCRKEMGEGKYDEMVKVGDFWVDRYEMKLYTNPDCTGDSFTGDDAHVHGFFRNGIDDPPNGKSVGDFVAMYGCSVQGVAPGRVITWFQAQRACNLSGKHLCSNSEWQAAALGTPDPNVPEPSQPPGPEEQVCNIWANTKPAGAVWAVMNSTVLTGSADACMSHCGAYDMVGNLWEWTADWWGQGGDQDHGNQPADGEFHGDGYWNVDNAQSAGYYDDGNPVFPAVALRGGAWSDGVEAGGFALHLTHGPADWGNDIGARCCQR